MWLLNLREVHMKIELLFIFMNLEKHLGFSYDKGQMAAVCSFL
jgi:hypothetical protein